MILISLVLCWLLAKQSKGIKQKTFFTKGKTRNAFEKNPNKNKNLITQNIFENTNGLKNSKNVRFFAI